MAGRNAKSPDAERTQRRAALNARRYETFKIEDRTDWPKLQDGSRNRSLKALKGFRPSRLRFYQPHDEWDDNYWGALMTDLYFCVYEFAGEYFHDHTPWPAKMTKLPWLMGSFSKEFLQAAKAIATQDPLTGGWDGVLADPARRASLVVGIIARVLEQHVFQPLLFGASPEQMEMLTSQDRATLEADGYTRTALRSRTVQLVLGANILTPSFWPAVDTVAMQTTALLLPLVQLLDAALPAAPGYSTAALHQAVHTVVARAGYTAICLRRSASIFRFEFPAPAQPWDADTQPARPEPHDESKRVARVLSDLVARRFLDATETTAAVAGAGEEAEKEQTQQAQKRRAALGGPARVDKVQIVLWPCVKRYRAQAPGALGGADVHASSSASSGVLCTNEGGEWISTICKAQVVYYAGLFTRSDTYIRPPGGEPFTLNEIHVDVMGETVMTSDGWFRIPVNAVALRARQGQKAAQGVWSERLPLDRHIVIMKTPPGKAGWYLGALLGCLIVLSLAAVWMRA